MLCSSLSFNFYHFIHRRPSFQYLQQKQTHDIVLHFLGVVICLIVYALFNFCITAFSKVGGFSSNSYGRMCKLYLAISISICLCLSLSLSLYIYRCTYIYIHIIHIYIYIHTNVHMIMYINIYIYIYINIDIHI
jgi:hypothetical protein